MFGDDDHTATVDAARAHALHHADDDHLADYDLLVTEIKADIEQERKEPETTAVLSPPRTAYYDAEGVDYEPTF